MEADLLFKEGRRWPQVPTGKRPDSAASFWPPDDDAKVATLSKPSNENKKKKTTTTKRSFSSVSSGSTASRVRLSLSLSLSFHRRQRERARSICGGANTSAHLSFFGAFWGGGGGGVASSTCGDAVGRRGD